MSEPKTGEEVFQGLLESLGFDQSSINEILLRARVQGITFVQEVLPDPPCTYTFAHTRHWCGNNNCRWG